MADRDLTFLAVLATSLNQASCCKELAEFAEGYGLDKLERKKVAVHVQIDHRVGNLVVEEVEPARLIGQLQTMHVGGIDALAKKGMAVVVTAQQHVDAGLTVLITVPVIHPVVRHLQDAKIRDGADTLDGLERWFTINPVAAECDGLEAEMRKPKGFSVLGPLPAIVDKRECLWLKECKTSIKLGGCHGRTN